VNAFLIGIPTTLSRIDGMHMSVPTIKAQALVSSWKRQDIVSDFVMDRYWVHVDGVPYTVRHFQGLWFSYWLYSGRGSCLSLELGVVCILIAMRDLDGSNPPCLEVVALLKLNGYRLLYLREAAGYVPYPRF
jgi:hypothetical protein